MENLTSQEYHRGKWKLYNYSEDVSTKASDVDVADPIEVLEKNVLFEHLLQEFKSIGQNRI